MDIDRLKNRAAEITETENQRLLERSPGSASLFERVLGLKTVLFSFSTADEQLHAPNEFFRLSRLEEGVAQRRWPLP